MKNTHYYILFWIGVLCLFSCNNVKKIKSNAGVVNVGNNNFIINFPEIDSTYSSKEVEKNILLLQNQFSSINKEIYKKSPLNKKDLHKFEIIDTLVTDIPNDFTHVNSLKETREQMFEAQKAWENLLYNRNKKKQFHDEKSKALIRYKDLLDSLSKDARDLQITNKSFLDSMLTKNITPEKIDSMLSMYLFETGDKLPIQDEFVRKLDGKSYQRMMTLREEDLEILKKGKSPYRIKLTNDSSDKIFVAVRYYALDNQWVVSGWYSVEPNSSENIFLYAKKDEFHYYA